MSQTPPEDLALNKSGMGAKGVAQTSWWGRLSRRVKLLIAVIVAVVIIGLAVGLGVGLTIGKHGGGDDGGDEPSSTFSPTPSPGPTNIWQPAVNSSWQIVLLQPIELKQDATSVTPDVSVYDIDMYTNSKEVISTLKKLGKKVICYFSAGSFEPNRPDSGDFHDSDKGLELDGWPGEYWLQLNSTNVRSIMKGRIEYAAAKGCDAIDPDNVDGYNNKNGLGLTAQDSIDFMHYLSSVATPLNLSMGLKNAGDIIPHVLDITQFSVNEQCAQFSECRVFAPFVQAGKPVFQIEYPDGAPHIETSQRETICNKSSGKAAGSEGFSTVMKKMNLDGFIEFCDGTTAETPLDT